MATTVTIKTDTTRVELTKGLIKYLHGTIAEEEFRTLATVLGYKPGEDAIAFINFAYDQALGMLS